MKSIIKPNINHIFPSHWAEENISKPNLIAKRNALKICRDIYEKYDLQPDRIMPTKEEGIYIVYNYVDIRCNRSLVIETYNDAESAAVVCDNNDKENVVIYKEDINDLNFEDAIRVYKGKT